MSYTPRPKEALQELRTHYSYVELLYNEKLNGEWILVCENNEEDITMKGETHTDVLIGAVREKREK